jgi:hypothetical protein
MAGITGKAIALTIGATPYPITAHNISNTCELQEDSNSKSNGRTAWVAGFTHTTGSVEAYYDPADNPIPSLKPGDTATLILAFDGTENQTIPVIVESLEFSSPVKGKVTFTVNFTATGYDVNTELTAL